MTTCVIDASVAAKWFLPREGEPLADEALAVALRFSQGELSFIVPDLFWAEMANVFWKAVRQKRWSAAAAEDSLREILGRGLPSVPSASLAEMALSIAIASERSMYDCIYLALAIDSKTYFLTADRRLVNAVGTDLPVKWLGSPQGF